MGGLEGLSKSYRYVHWNLQKHRHTFPNGSPRNSCIIRPWATSRKALKALETSIHCLHRTTHKQPEYATSWRVGVTAKGVHIPNVHCHSHAVCLEEKVTSQHWVWYWWLTLKLWASIFPEVSKLRFSFFPIQSQKLQLCAGHSCCSKGWPHHGLCKHDRLLRHHGHACPRWRHSKSCRRLPNSRGPGTRRNWAGWRNSSLLHTHAHRTNWKRDNITWF